MQNHDALEAQLNQLDISQDACLACFSIDNLSSLNHTYGHRFGSKVLLAFFQRLENRLGKQHPITRVSGNLFVILARKENFDEALHLLHATVSSAFNVDDCLLEITVSTGVARFPTDGQGLATLITKADLAMIHARDFAGNHCEFYIPGTQEKVAKKHQLATQLKQAIANKDFQLAYQGQFNTDRQLIGVEALLRWSVCAPSTFIPLAEESGLILPLGEWVIQTACAEFVKKNMSVPLGINLSAKQFHQKDILELLTRCKDATGIRLECEITESTLLSHPESAIKTMQAMRDADIGVAIDDFGTGHSSLSYLQKLPASKLKLDRSFIQNINNNADHRAIVSATSFLAHHFNLVILAEGVETQAEFNTLVELGVDAFQGNYFQQPQTQ